MQKINGLILNAIESEEKLFDLACKKSGIAKNKVKHFRIVKKSLDARDKNKIVYNYSVEISNKEQSPYQPVYKKVSQKAKVLVVGAGPAGLFCALELLRYGFAVTIVERGKKVEDRKADVEQFLNFGVLNENSNVQFGEGGAGAFSDGKLNTQVNSEYAKRIPLEFVKFGAPQEVAYLSKPHVGSDNLPKVVKNIREEIIRLGGNFLYETCFTDFEIKNGKIASVKIGNKIDYFDEVVLAVGHSASDVYQLCNKKGVFLEPKEFAVGFRIEHLASDINLSQYGEKYNKLNLLPTADYKLVSHNGDRSAFTFCMCPGGVVIPSSSEKNTVVTNGMSNYLRNLENSNSAIIVQAKFSDFGNGLFDGLNFRNLLEKKAFLLGGEDYSAPVSLVGDYLKNQNSSSFGKVKPTYQVGVKKSNLNEILPSKLNETLKFAIVDMSKRLKGFDSYDGVLTAVESRTSSPIRITRNENFTSINVANLYPCGEGCGYAGGIVSAGADGLKVANKIYQKYNLR